MKNTDDVNVHGKIALITGAARGIGRACPLPWQKQERILRLG